MNEMKSSQHLSYMLRLWWVNEPSSTTWRASIEIPETGKRIGFASLEQLFAYLMDLTEGQDGGQIFQDQNPSE